MLTFFVSFLVKKTQKPGKTSVPYQMRIAHENCFYFRNVGPINAKACLLYTSDAADE